MKYYGSSIQLLFLHMRMCLQFLLFTVKQPCLPPLYNAIAHPHKCKKFAPKRAMIQKGNRENHLPIMNANKRYLLFILQRAR